MANRDMTHTLFSFEKMRKMVNARVSVGVAGAVTLDAPNSKGVASVTRLSAGQWQIQFGYNANGNVFQDLYNRLLAFGVHMNTSGVGAGARSSASYGADVISDTVAVDGKLTIQFAGPTSSAVTTAIAVDPASGEVAYLSFDLGDSSAP